MVTQVTTVLLTSLGTDWTQSHQGNKIAMLLLFSVIFQKEFLIPSYSIPLRVLTMPIGVFLSVCNHHYNELCMCCLQLLVLGVKPGGGRTPFYIIPCYRCFFHCTYSLYYIWRSCSHIIFQFCSFRCWVTTVKYS